MKKAPPRKITKPVVKQKKEQPSQTVKVESPPYWFIICIGLIVYVLFFSNSDQRMAAKAQLTGARIADIPTERIDLSFIQKIPTEPMNGYCAQPTIEQLHMMGQSDSVKVVIRLNEGGKVSLLEQDSILWIYGKKMIFIDTDLKRSPANVHQILKKHKGIIVHDENGKLTVKSFIGYHLKQSEFTIDERFEFLNLIEDLNENDCNHLAYLKRAL